MAELHPALKGKSQEEIDRICDDMQEQLTKNFYNINGWRSSRDQEEAPPARQSVEWWGGVSQTTKF